MHGSVQRINKGLENCRLGRPLLIFEEVGSTNDILKSQADSGAPEGCTVIADNQTQGRGRMGRKWLSLKGKGLYMSVLLRPEWQASDSLAVSMLSALAVARVLKRMGVANIALKWPNDVRANGRKIAGILVEPRVGADLMDYCVVGIGVNVSHDAEDLRPIGAGSATSCRMEGVNTDRDEVLIQVLKELDECYAGAAHGNRSWIIEEWTRQSGLGMLNAGCGIMAVAHRPQMLDWRCGRGAPLPRMTKFDPGCDCIY